MSCCARCGIAFHCGAADRDTENAPCWCMQMPPLSEKALAELRQRYGECLCPSCLSDIGEAMRKEAQR